LVKFYIEDFPLNAKFIYEEAELIIENNRRINFVTYLIRDVREFFGWQRGSNQEGKDLFKRYHSVSTEIFYQICNICTLKTS
jgi:hypothetical protein